ncbi:MAG: hypothetical protein ABW161_06200 [Candidatus Thiodiazotropha sp.]
MREILGLGPVNTNPIGPKTIFRIFVISAQAGIQEYRHHQAFWIPACAGITVVVGLSKRHSSLTLFSSHG